MLNNGKKSITQHMHRQKTEALKIWIEGFLRDCHVIDTRKAVAAYFKHDAPGEGILWRRSYKGTGKLSSKMSVTSATCALTKRVKLLGRHAGGWNSPAMPLLYIEAAPIANQGTPRVKAAWRFGDSLFKFPRLPKGVYNDLPILQRNQSFPDEAASVQGHL